MADPLGDSLAEFATAGRGEVVDDDGTVVVQWSAPENADDANRMLRKLRSLQRRRAEIQERYDAERVVLDDWHEDLCAGVDREMRRLEDALEGWMRGQHAMRGVVTEKLPSGDLWLREPRQAVEVTDEAALVKWLVAHHQQAAVKVTEAVLKTEAAKTLTPGPVVLAGDAGPDHEYREARFTEDGTVVPGVALRIPKRKTFSVHVEQGGSHDRDRG